MPISKVIYYGKTLMDLTDSTVNPENLATGEVAYNSAGERIVGTADMNKGATFEVVEETLTIVSEKSVVSEETLEMGEL